MCLIAVAWQAHPRWRLALAGNRDEFHARPTLPLAPWQDDARIVGGRDLEHGGGWLALRGARLAAVTNVRRLPPPEGLSRGELVADFLREDRSLETALAALESQAAQYRPFNLLLHDGRTLALATNLPEPHPAFGDARRPSAREADTGSGAHRAPHPDPHADPRSGHRVPRDDDPRAFARRILSPGIHGLSNGALDVVWPKTARLQAALEAWLRSRAAGHLQPDPTALFDALADTATAPDAALPDTGLGRERERWLSSTFIRSPQYGTRASTVVLIADDHALIHERRFGPDGVFLGETRLRVAG